MRIGIDVRYLSHGLMGGVYRYVAELVPALYNAAPEHEFFLYADTKRPFELTDLPANVQVRYLPYKNGLSSVYNDFFMKRTMELDTLDVVHFPANYGFGPKSARTVITLHDHINVMPLLDIVRGHRKNIRTIVMMTYLHFCSVNALRGAQLLVTVSQYSKSKIIEYTGFDPSRIIPVTHGPAPTIRRITDQALLDDVRERHKLTKPFVLADGVKNPAALVNAWKLLPPELRQGYQMVFFSRTPTPAQEIFEAVAAGDAKLLIRAAHEDIIALYNMAKAFVFPSWYEGLGLPLLEAMICGTPVVASDRGSIPEVAGNAALMTDVDDIQGLANNLTKVLTDSAEAERLRQLGFARAANFAWDKTAQRYLEIYEQVMSLPLKK